MLGAQGVFNLGFYAVVPFIAIVLAEDFALGGAAVGLVLGVRTAAQQGMFLLGGILADRYGARSLILTGCAVRAAGFGTLAASVSWQHSLTIFILGTVLTGLGGALFSPALNTLVARTQAQREDRDLSTTAKPTLFAALSVVGETGAAIGPFLGAALLGWGFGAAAGAGAALFVLVGLLLGWLLPRPPHRAHAVPQPAGRGKLVRGSGGIPPRRRCASLRHRGFIAFTALHAVDLLSYNQLYLSLPAEIRRSGADVETLAWLFAMVSLITVTLQLPISRLARRLGPQRALPLGYLTTAAGFLLLAACSTTAIPVGLELAPATTAVALWILGHLMAAPVALDLVPRFAGTAQWGSYYGLLATAGGIAVLLGNAAAGSLLHFAAFSEALSWAPWLLLGTLPLISATLIGRTLPTPPQLASTSKTPEPSAENTEKAPDDTFTS
ncbi:MFS transporter [Nesterenkonia aurantiaca]|uniref:MFS transporter n=1 Tax=Nesterenkonia aurantiaca TaxID=1436010 RepID=A0A4R7G5G6_9MICC|nr:MFS transporter [Nesterenkonia aurantiaca]